MRLVVLAISLLGAGLASGWHAAKHFSINKSAAPDGSQVQLSSGPSSSPSKSHFDNAPVDGLEALLDFKRLPSDATSRQLYYETGRAKVAYAQLFSRWGAGPQERDKIAELLAARQATTANIMATSREQGIAPSGRLGRAIGDTISEARNRYDIKIKETVGAQKWEELILYEKQEPQRNSVNELRFRLLDTPFPLQPSQRDRLIEMLYEDKREDRAVIFDGARRSAVFSFDFVRKAGTILSGEQLPTLATMAAEQLVQIEILKSRQPRPPAGPVSTGSQTISSDSK
ncbi:MAG TPA: hypothetical protein VHD62_01610 [Opitutaceae bacterium]|nr:hypothetical protein [Opitutaceae bacterium]